MITPDIIAKSGTEHGIQAAFFAFANVARLVGFPAAWTWAEGDKNFVVKANPGNPLVPELKWLHAIPNGGARGDDEQTRKIRGATMKAEGVRDGVSDVFLPVPKFPYHGLYIEFKTPTGAIRDSQTEFGTFALAQGYAFSVERSWRDAARLLQSYVVGIAPVNLKRK